MKTPQVSIQNKKFKKGIFIQSRMTSSRLPGKMMKPFCGIPLVEYVYRRCLTARDVDVIAVLTSTELSDTILYDYCRKMNIPVFRGDLNNVLHRYIEAANYYHVDYVCRVCGDSPFVDTAMIAPMFHEIAFSSHDYISLAGCIDGFFSEIVSTSTLKKVAGFTSNLADLEHVTLFIRNNPDKFKIKTIHMDNGHLRSTSLTIDQPEDFKYCQRIASLLRTQDSSSVNLFDFSSKNILEIIECFSNNHHKEILNENF